MLSRKPRKPKAVKHETCPECGAIKRYAICASCGWMDKKTKEKDRELKRLIEKSGKNKRPKIKRKSWGFYDEKNK